MKKKSIFILLFLFTHVHFIYAQLLNTDSSLQTQELIQGLVGSDCATITNVTSSVNGSVNNIDSYGTFDRAGSSFPFDNGLVLSTGDIYASGNNIIAEDLSDGEIDWGTDPDIMDVLGIDQTLNATSIEFDFVSANNFIAFKYLFASDEYQQEYPCNFRDVFAILIKRAGTTDPYVNIATVPDTNTEISTNTVRPNINGFCDAMNEQYYQGYNTGYTNFNGNTTPITASTEIIPNQTYHIKMVIADHIDERFDSAVFIAAEGFGNSIDLGPDQSICGSDLTLNALVDNPSATYTWYLNNNIITGESSPTLQVSTSGTYTVDVTLPFGSNNCVLTDSINLEIIPFQNAAPIADLTICDSLPSDGLFDFDFNELKDDEIFDNLPSNDYTISYHLSLEGAQNNTDAIVGTYQNSEETETIFVRIQSLNGDCLQIGNFNISVLFSPNTYDLTVEVCNNAFSDQAYSSLSFMDFPVSNFEYNTTVSYHITEEEAIDNINPLSHAPDFQDEPDAFYARVVSDFTGCASVVPIHLTYADVPDIGRYILNYCVSPSYTEEIDGITYDYENFPVTYQILDIFENIEAEFPDIWVNLEMFIADYPPTITTAATNFNIGISIRYHGENCPTYMSIEVHKNLLYNLLEDDYQIRRCDDNSNDGIVDINLLEMSEELKNGFDDIDIDFYLSEEDRNNQNNPLDIDNLVSLAHSQSLYLLSSYEGCTHRSKVTLSIDPGLNLQPKTIDYCGSTDVENNTANIALPPLKDLFINDLTITGPVEFYLTADDAENQENEITETYSVTGNQQLFYVRMTNIFTGCYDITTMQVNIANSFNISPPSSIIICDPDQDLITTLNLETVLTDISDDISNINFTFFESFDDALEEVNQIQTPNSYTTSSREIFLRAEEATLGCFSILNFNISVNSAPHLGNINDYIDCTIDTNTPSGFLLVNKDPEIINGQDDMEVLYFLSEEDALDRTNPIDKSNPYFANTNPQTLYVRLENSNENSCFEVAPMQIEVRQAPIYSIPNDVYECDVNKNGLVSTDLNEKIIEITQGSSQNLEVSFHATPLNAEIGANPLPLQYTSVSNPQLVYARIENTDSGCAETETFYINALSLPEITYQQTMVACANNNISSLQWDLTSKEVDILDGRQYNIDFTYFTSQEDLDNDTNPIDNPETFVNTSNPQSVFVRIRNASTGCYDSAELELLINMPPEINDFGTFHICENDNNTVDLNEIDEILLEDTYNIIISYYLSLEDAEANQNAMDNDYNYISNDTSVFARAEYSTTHCYVIYPFQLVVNPNPIANTPSNLHICDDDFDDEILVNLSSQNQQILGNQDTNLFSISYYNTLSHAEEATSPLNTDYIASNNEIIFARIENNDTGCYSITQFSVIVEPLPIANIDDQVICLDNLPLIVSAETFDPSDTYLWSTGETSPEIEISEIGNYSVSITNAFGCLYTDNFEVIESESAIIDVVETVDFSDPNNITVTVNGIGNYRYRLNDLDFQDSNVFINVPIGYNTITIEDVNGCAQVTHEVVVIDAPKHMSPNGDGDFDRWHIAGIQEIPGTTIEIFDRYGKLMKVLDANTLGWDGTYNGKQMPASDYWYIAYIVQNGKTFQFTGHFSIRR